MIETLPVNVALRKFTKSSPAPVETVVVPLMFRFVPVARTSRPLPVVIFRLPFTVSAAWATNSIPIFEPLKSSVKSLVVVTPLVSKLWSPSPPVRVTVPITNVPKNCVSESPTP